MLHSLAVPDLGQRALIDVPDYVTPGLVEDGGEFVVPPSPAMEPPAWVYPYQARMVLLQHGLLDAVAVIVENADSATKIAWEYAVEIHRDSPLITTLGTAIGLTSEQIDDLFLEASTY